LDANEETREVGVKRKVEKTKNCINEKRFNAGKQLSEMKSIFKESQMGIMMMMMMMNKESRQIELQHQQEMNLSKKAMEEDHSREMAMLRKQPQVIPSKVYSKKGNY
jgi:hypothetical protein